jgi:hypothetical protein
MQEIEPSPLYAAEELSKKACETRKEFTMIQLQIVGKERAKLQPLIRSAIQSGKIKAFSVAKVRGGLKILHAKHPGSIKFAQKGNVLFATVRCKNREKEWQLLQSLIGRLTYHFRDNLTAINIQLE